MESANTQPQSSPNVVFDLGGVLVRIAQTWQQALESAGVTSEIPSQPAIPLTDFAPFNAYQANEMTLEEYLEDLSKFLGVEVEEARHTHLSILREMYPRIDELVDRLNAQGVRTGCLSNTNAPHWYEMTQTERFAPVSRLSMRAGSHELGFAKPDERAFEAYMRQFGLRGAPVIYFDDAPKNVETARKIGWQAHLIDPYGDPASQIEKLLRSSCE